MKIETLAICNLAYLRRIGPYGPENQALMATFKAWLTSEALFTQVTILGIALDDPTTVPAAACRYDVGAILPDMAVPKRPLSQRKLMGGHYAVFELAHTQSAMSNGYQYLIQQLQQAQLKRRPGPIIERYRPALVQAGKCELLVPIEAELA
ncbi:GyrI-like domain-containing protein [Lactiplantibacillus daowaiensis]|uniref:GyrI-like domain-containing protein n=1 Tax=Lactiplantibacillus daowaiensis TaxID=2559918 RepID=A0ABW1S1D0_9LACO|nr:GyrI-like domain-containing protein [Lactiplantibacillus daowaiensis]